MPNCVSFTRKGEAEPIGLNALDAELAAHFGEPCHPSRWFRGWYHLIAFGLAVGRTFDQMRQEIRDDTDEQGEIDPYRLMPVIDYIETNFTPSAWAEIGRR